MKSLRSNIRSLWFKRWSRNANAAFLSIGKVVHIGHLKVDICRMAMLKSGVVGCCEVWEQVLGADEERAEREDSTDDTLLQSLLLQLLASTPNVQVKTAAAASADALAVTLYSMNPTTKDLPFVVGFFVSETPIKFLR